MRTHGIMKNPAVESFATTLKPHLPKLFRLACRLTPTKADAEDLFHDVLVKLFSRRTELTSIRELAPWLGRVLYNQFVDDVRRYGRQPVKLVGTSDPVEELADPDTDPTRSLQQAELSAALQKLSEDHRTVLVLHDVEGYTLKEIAELFDTPEGTLKSRLHRARARLRELLSKEGTFSATAACNAMNGDSVDAL